MSEETRDQGSEGGGHKGKAQIIIKKYKRIAGGHHGGSWKVAYADFVTAMMAFFLLMWLISILSPQTKQRVADYFNHYSIFEKGGASSMSPRDSIPDKSMINLENVKKKEKQGINSEELAEKLKEKVAMSLKAFQNRIMILLEDGNVRIEIADTEGDPLFFSGKAEMQKNGKDILKEITEVLKIVDKKITVEGHTDSTGFGSRSYTNWELSTQRALAARTEFEKNGFDSHNIKMIAGYADTRPLIKENPASPFNRRISILIDFKSTEEDSGMVDELPDAPIQQQDNGHQ